MNIERLKQLIAEHNRLGAELTAILLEADDIPEEDETIVDDLVDRGRRLVLRTDPGRCRTADFGEVQAEVVAWLGDVAERLGKAPSVPDVIGPTTDSSERRKHLIGMQRLVEGQLKLISA